MEKIALSKVSQGPPIASSASRAASRTGMDFAMLLLAERQAYQPPGESSKPVSGMREKLVEREPEEPRKVSPERKAPRPEETPALQAQAATASPARSAEENKPQEAQPTTGNSAASSQSAAATTVQSAGEQGQVGPSAAGLNQVSPQTSTSTAAADRQPGNTSPGKFSALVAEAVQTSGTASAETISAQAASTQANAQPGLEQPTMQVASQPQQPAAEAADRQAQPGSTQNLNQPGTFTPNQAAAQPIAAVQASAQNPSQGPAQVQATEQVEGISSAGKLPLAAELAQAAGLKGTETTSRSTELSQPTATRSTDLARQVEDGLETLVKSGKNSLQVHLNPKELGRIDLHMVTTAEGTWVTIRAAQPLTGQLLEQHLHELRQSLESAGVQLGGLNLSQSSFQSGPGGQSAAQQWQQKHPAAAQALQADSTTLKELNEEVQRRPRSADVPSSVDYRI